MRTLNLLVACAAVSCGIETEQETSFDLPDLPRHQLIFAHQSDVARKDYDIWRMCGDGTQMASLVAEPGEQLQVSVSPDGNEFVYTNKLEASRDIWRKPFGRGEAINITNHPGEDSQPAWSPDGGHIAFFSNRDTEKLELYLLDLEGGSIKRLTQNSFYDSGAAWSPDGGKIVFTRFFPAPEGSEQGGTGEIVQLDLAAGEETVLTQLGGYNGGLSYSPDGRLITFHHVDEAGSDLWVIEADGSNPRAITDTYIDEYSPEWSPDGNWIAFTAGVENDGRGTFDIWLMRPDGSGRQVLNKAGNSEGWQKWRPGEHYCR